MDLLILISSNIPDWLEAILGILVALQVVATLTTTPKDDEAINKAVAYLHTIIRALSYRPNPPPTSTKKDVE